MLSRSTKRIRVHKFQEIAGYVRTRIQKTHLEESYKVSFRVIVRLNKPPFVVSVLLR